jgi:ribonuclease P protein component
MKIVSLKNRKDFLKTAASGKKAVAKGLVLQVLEHPQSSPDSIRIGFTATKKLGNAVVRNRIKRRLRALVADVMPTRAKNSYDYVIIGRQSALDRGFEELKKDLKFALHDSGTHV